jgi:hypothetical protein
MLQALKDSGLLLKLFREIINRDGPQSRSFMLMMEHSHYMMDLLQPTTVLGLLQNY